jgi:hypothetical protein
MQDSVGFTKCSIQKNKIYFLYRVAMSGLLGGSYRCIRKSDVS